MGMPLGNLSASSGWYINTEMVEKLGVPIAHNQELYNAHYFNLLMTRRGVSFGWDWKKHRQQDHPILLNERKNNVLSLINSIDKVPQSFRLQPVSMRGRQALINYRDGIYNPTLRTMIQKCLWAVSVHIPMFTSVPPNL